MKKSFLFIFIISICLISVYFSFNSEKDYSKLTIEELHSLAKKDDTEAQFTLGGYYQYGVKVAVDLNESMKWYKESAENGHTDAMVNLGYLYREGIGTEQNLEKAFDWNLKAAEKGNPSGMFNVGKKFEYGIGVEKNQQQADYWLEKVDKIKR